MIKNTAGQTIGAQMINASTGAAFTGAVTVAVTVDAGTQATGSVGSGACTHEGGGYHTYAPAQAETNGDLVAFTFSGTGAIPVTVQVYTVAGDAFSRLGAPAGASVSADVAAIKAETATILSDTNDIQARLPAALVSGRMDSSVGAMAANVMTAAAAAADLTTELQSGLATAASITSLDGKIGTVSNLGSGATLAANLADIEAQTDDIGAAGAGLTALATAAELAKVPKSDGTATWNATALASLQSEATDALNAYDPPTRAELTTDTNSVLTAVGDVPTNAELATALAAADDAVLAVLGTPAGASLAVDVAAVKAETATILSDTNDIQTRIPAALVGGRMDATVDATGMESGAIDAILDDTIGDGTITVRQALRVLIAGMAGKLSGAATTTITIRNLADSADVVVATVDVDGNRSAVTVTP